jgi:hypothetical protein
MDTLPLSSDTVAQVLVVEIPFVVTWNLFTELVHREIFRRPWWLALAVAEKSFSLEPFVLIVMHLMAACDIPSVRFFSSL